MDIKIQETYEDLCFGDDLVLKYSLQYPYFSSPVFGAAANMMNRHHRNRAAICRQQLCQSLYCQAVRALQSFRSDGMPFRPFEAVYTTTIAYNQDCTLSLYYDAYRYTGGAHGSTIRHAETWDLCCARRMPMARFFKCVEPYKAVVIRDVTAQMAAQIEEGSGAYFDDYEALAARYFNTNQFFIVPEGLVVYYQQYQVAPYASGLPQFLLPFSAQVLRPRYSLKPV